MQLLLDAHISVKAVCLGEASCRLAVSSCCFFCPYLSPSLDSMFPRLTVIPRWKFEKELNLSLEAPSSSGDCQLFRSHPPPLGTQRFYVSYVFRNFDSQHILIP